MVLVILGVLILGFLFAIAKAALATIGQPRPYERFALNIGQFVSVLVCIASALGMCIWLVWIALFCSGDYTPPTLFGETLAASLLELLGCFFTFFFFNALDVVFRHVKDSMNARPNGGSRPWQHSDQNLNGASGTEPEQPHRVEESPSSAPWMHEGYVIEVGQPSRSRHTE